MNRLLLTVVCAIALQGCAAKRARPWEGFKIPEYSPQSADCRKDHYPYEGELPARYPCRLDL